MKLAYICSPCRGDYEKNIIKAQEYCRSTTCGGRQESQRGYCGSYQHRSDGGLRTRRNDCEQPEKWQLNVERGCVI